MLVNEETDLKEVQLNALLDISQIANREMSDNELYKLLYFKLQSNMSVKMLALYAKDDDDLWRCRTCFCADTASSHVIFDKKLLDMSGGEVSEDLSDFPDSFSSYDVVIPIVQQGEFLAYLFMKGDNIAYSFARALTSLVLMVIENKKLLKKQIAQQVLLKELEIAKNVQEKLVSSTFDVQGIMEVCASYLPHNQMIGGDYYDCITLNENQVLVCIADVSGKGISAALLMANFQASLHMLIKQKKPFFRTLSMLNSHVYHTAKGEHLITFFGAIYNRKEKTIQYINAGHHPPFLLDLQKNKPYKLDKGTTLLGALPDLPKVKLNVLPNMNEFILFLYTDGVTEATNKKGERLGINRLFEFFVNNKNFDIHALKEELLAFLFEYSEGVNFSDDVTFLVSKPI